MSDRQIIGSGGPWEDVYGYSRAVRVGDHVRVAGTTAALPGGGAEGETTEAQAREVLRRIALALQGVGAGIADVVATRMYVTDIAADADAVGRVHGEVFRHVRPAATMVEVSRLIAPELKVEIEVEAVVTRPGSQGP